MSLVSACAPWCFAPLDGGAKGATPLQPANFSINRIFREEEGAEWHHKAGEGEAFLDMLF